MAIHVERVDAAATLPLRQQVLRPHESLEELRLAAPPDDPASGHYAAIVDGAVIGTASVWREEPPWPHAEQAAWRLRGMATAEGWRNQGVGAAVLDAVVDHVREHGGGLLWCNARTPALSFYSRAGFATRGEPWVDPVIGPHVAMERVVEGGSPSASASGLYDAIRRRRDVRAEFTGAPVPASTLHRLLSAAHAAPSVGLTQPWDFILVTTAATRSQFQTHVAAERELFAASLPPERAERFADIKIEGIMESSLGIVVTYDSSRGAPDVLGRHAIADAGLYSTCLAIENLWLAATAEGYGVGWVSFYREEHLRHLLGIPDHVRPVAWLCVGPVSALQEVPDLERHRWRARRPLEDAVHRERW